MNHYATVFIIVIATNPFVESRSLDIGNFLFGNSRTKTSMSVTPSQDPTNLPSVKVVQHLNDSENGIDPNIFLSSSEQRSEDSGSSNSTTGSSTIGQLNTTDSFTTLSNNISNHHQKNESQTNTSLSSTSTVLSTLVNGKISTTMAHIHENKSTESTTSDEIEEVVLGTMRATTILIPKTIYQRSIEWMESAYTLSILIPVAAGVLFATTIITMIALCRCMKRCCRRRRFRKKCLPDSVKNLRPADRARLLGESSDDEF